MQIHQLQMSYSPEEDRIILRIGSTTNEEICLFFTRRLINEFWTILVPAMQQQSEPVLNDMQRAPEIPEVKKIKQEIQHQKIIEKSDYTTPFNQSKAPSIEEAPMLIVKISIKTNDNAMTSITFSSTDGKNINLNLNQELMHNLYELIIKILPSTNWALALEGLANVATIENEARATLH